jgi:peptide/nickel transport system permease protein
MSTQLDLVPVKPTTAIVGEAEANGARKSGRSIWWFSPQSSGRC